MSVGDCLLSDIRVAAFWYYKAQPQPITFSKGFSGVPLLPKFRGTETFPY